MPNLERDLERTRIEGEMLERDLERTRIEGEMLERDDDSAEVYFNKERFVPKRLGDRIMKGLTFKTIKGNGVYVYDNGIYVEKGDKVIASVANSLLGEKTTSHRVKETRAYIEYSTYIEEDEINSDPNLICLENGIFNVNETGLYVHTPEMFMTTRLPIRYDEDADCPEIKEFIKQVVDEGDIDVIQEIIGYCLWKSYPVQKAVMFIGEGANGKSTLLDLIKRFLGQKNISSVPLQDFDTNRFAKARLFGKLANMFNDVSDKALKETGMFKQLTGEDTVTGERKFQDGFQFTNYAKMLFSTNKLPESRDDTQAFYRRWIFITFPNTFTGDAAIPKDELLKKLTTEGEMSGLFNWAIQGLKRLLKQGDFSKSTSTEETRQQYIRLSSPIQAFVEDMVEVDSGSYVPKEEFYGAYVQYCKDNNLPALDKAVFARRVIIVIPTIRASQHNIGGKNGVRCFDGVKLTSKPTHPTQPTQVKSYFSVLGE
jgi:putative DNA primase/helicase